MMTREEAAQRLYSCRAGPDGRGDDREPGLVFERLRALYRNTKGRDLTTLNEAIRSWLQSSDETDQFYALFMTVEFKITENRDLVQRLMDEAETGTGPGAPYRWAKLNRILAKLSD